jgi:hypothetical protein
MRFAVLVLLMIGCSPPPASRSGGGGGGGGTTGGDGSVGPKNVDCQMRIGLRCGTGKVDGCVGGKTTVHVCIDENEQPGPPCAQEIAKQCPAGQTDACLKSPPAANHHICVY